MTNVQNIFMVNGIKDRNAVKISSTNNVNLQMPNSINDVMDDKFNIMNNVYGEIYKCNITGHFLMTSKKWPLSYINVVYEKPLRRFLIFRMTLYFTIESEINEPEYLIDSEINGKFTYEITMNGNNRELETIDTFSGNDEVNAKYKTFVNSNEMTDLIILMINDINNAIKKEYAKELEYFTLPQKYLSVYNLDKNK